MFSFVSGVIHFFRFNHLALHLLIFKLSKFASANYNEAMGETGHVIQSYISTKSATFESDLTNVSSKRDEL